jgi:hypothetical protein
MIIWSKTINTTKKNTKSLLCVSKEVGLEVKAKKKYMFMPHHQNAWQIHNLNTADKSL